MWGMHSYLIRVYQIAPVANVKLKKIKKNAYEQKWEREIEKKNVEVEVEMFNLYEKSYPV